MVPPIFNPFFTIDISYIYWQSSFSYNPHNSYKCLFLETNMSVFQVIVDGTAMDLRPSCAVPVVRMMPCATKASDELILRQMGGVTCS